MQQPKQSRCYCIAVVCHDTKEQLVCRGIVTTSPSPTFLVLTNNTKARRAREHNQTAPAYLDWMTYHEFTALSKHKSRKLHFSQEFYYFQGIPHDELGLTHAFDTLPSLCWNAARWGEILPFPP